MCAYLSYACITDSTRSPAKPKQKRADTNSQNLRVSWYNDISLLSTPLMLALSLHVAALRLSDFLDVPDVWNCAVIEISVRVSVEILDWGAHGRSGKLLCIIGGGDTFLTGSLSSVAFVRSAALQQGFLAQAIPAQRGPPLCTSASSSSDFSTEEALQVARKKLPAAGTCCTCQLQQPCLVTADANVSISPPSLCNFCIFGISLSLFNPAHAPFDALFSSCFKPTALSSFFLASEASNRTSIFLLFLTFL